MQYSLWMVQFSQFLLLYNIDHIKIHKCLSALFQFTKHWKEYQKKYKLKYWVPYWMTIQAFILIPPVISCSHIWEVNIKTECFLCSHSCVGGEHPYSYYVSGKHTSTSEMHCEALPKASLASLWNVWYMYWLLLQTLLNQSAEVIWSSTLTMNWKQHELCYLQWGTLPQPWYGYCILMNGPESFTNQL